MSSWPSAASSIYTQTPTLPGFFWRWPEPSRLIWCLIGLSPRATLPSVVPTQPCAARWDCTCVSEDRTQPQTSSRPAANQRSSPGRVISCSSSTSSTFKTGPMWHSRNHRLLPTCSLGLQLASVTYAGCLSSFGRETNGCKLSRNPLSHPA